jgi:hypothetical protein
VSEWKFVIFNGELGFVNHLALIVTSELTKRSKRFTMNRSIIDGTSSVGWVPFGQGY